MPFPPIGVFLIAVFAGLAGGAIGTLILGGRLSSNIAVGVITTVVVATVLHA